MKKILIARPIRELLEQDNTFLRRTDIAVFTAASNDEALRIHRAERANLIITELDMPGMASEEFCSLIREIPDLRTASVIMVCADAPEEIERSMRCRANAVLLRPVHPLLLMVKAQQLLDIASRETLRVLLNVSVDGQARDDSFYCRTRNISATGMLIETEKRLEEGMRLSCVFYLPNAVKIRTPGKIVRAATQAPGDDEYQYGLVFTDLVPEVKQQLIDYVETASRRTQSGGQ